MITSSDNSKLSLVRKLQARKWREREGAFVTEGEDLLEAGRAAGWEPREVLVPAGSGLAGDEVEPDLLDSISALGSGTRVIAVWAIPGGEPAAAAVYLHGVSDPGNVGTIVRTVAALSGGAAVIGPGSADPYSPKAVRATMGALFAAPPVRGGIDATATPRLALVAHGGEDLDGAIAGLIDMAGDGASPPTLCLGGERDGLPNDVVERCDAVATIPVRSGAESLNVAAAAAIGLQRISSLAAGGDG